jgi:hypothetical protein
MPCSFCRNRTHNISTCMPLSIQRATSIYNDDIDHKPNHVDRHLEPIWWVRSNNQPFAITPATKNVIAILTLFRKLQNDSTFPEKELGYLIMENDFCRNPYGVIKFTINNNRMVIEEITDNWVSILDDYNRAIENIIRGRLIASRIEQLNLFQREEALEETLDEEALEEEALEEEEENNLSLVQREREREHREEIQRRQERLEREERERRHQERVDALITCDKVIETTECPICMEDLKSTNRMILRCGHQFCGDCIFTHFQKQYGCKCPSCRGEYALRVPGWQPPKDKITQQETFEIIRRLLMDTNVIEGLEDGEIEEESDIEIGF